MSSFYKRIILQFFKIIFIIILSNIITAFRIDNYKVGKVFLLVNNLIILPLYFSIKITIIDSNIVDHFYISY